MNALYGDIRREIVASAWTRDRVEQLGMTCDVETAAQILGISRTTAYRMVKGGTFPVKIRRIGRIYRIPVRHLLEFLDGDADEASIEERA